MKFFETSSSFYLFKLINKREYDLLSTIKGIRND